MREPHVSGLLWGTEPAQNFDSSTCPVGAQTLHETVTQPCGDHARSAYISSAFESERSRCVLPTPPKLTGMKNGYLVFRYLSMESIC